jgi:hypothetical protein
MSKIELKWVELVMGIIVLVSGVITFSFNTFATKDGVKESVVERLDRIENKLDRLIEGRHRLGQ